MTRSFGKCLILCLAGVLLLGGCGGAATSSSEARVPVSTPGNTASSTGSGAPSSAVNASSAAENSSSGVSSVPSSSAAVPSSSPSDDPSASSPEPADFTFPRLVADHMVLQRNASVRIWGGYPKDGEITVNFAGKNYKGSCKNGSFEVWVQTGEAGGPYTLTVSSGTDKRVLQDVLVGDVYICSGQSNMLMQVGGLKDKTLRNTPVPDQIRLFHVWTEPTAAPQEDFKNAYSVWVKTDASNIGQYDSFSAVGYIFGRTLYEELQIPIGIIQSCEGDTIAAAWMPEKDAKTVNKINQTEDALQRHIPSRMYNGMIHPLRKYTVKGVLWYQGESDLGNTTYQHSMTTLINAWRREFGNEKMTFTLIQLPRWASNNWFDLREQQKATALAVPNCTYSVNLDCGERADIHPQDKEPVGVRAAQATLRAFYGRNDYKQNPVYQSHKVEGSKVTVTLARVDRGLFFQTEKTPGGKDWVTVTEGTGFEIMDASGVYYPAKAVLENNKLVLTSTVTEPKGIRYAYGNFPDVSLFDKNGLPAEQFCILF